MIATHFGEVWKAAARPMTIRPACLDDLSEIARRLIHHYAGRATPAQVMVGAPWMIWAINSRDRLVLIGPNSFGVAQIGTSYGCERKAKVDILCCRPSGASSFEALRMLRKMLAWARRRGAQTMRLEADNDVDLEPFARRLKADRKILVQYEIPV